MQPLKRNKTADFWNVCSSALKIPDTCASACRLHQSFNGFKSGKKSDCWSVTVGKKIPKQILIFPGRKQWFPNRTVKSLSSVSIRAGVWGKMAVLLCNWGLSITGFMHNFRRVTHLSCCFEALDTFAWICLALFYSASRVDKMTRVQCVRWIMISPMSDLAVEGKLSWNLSASGESGIDCDPFVTLISGDSAMGH